jgi:undecaprenyl-diphosphatase
VHWLIRYVSRHDFVPFAWYRIAFGLLLLALTATGVLKWA